LRAGAFFGVPPERGGLDFGGVVRARVVEAADAPAGRELLARGCEEAFFATRTLSFAGLFRVATPQG